MNLSTILIDPEEAKEELKTYTDLDNRSAEDEAIAMGLRAAARGLPLIMLSEAIRAGGYFEDGLPKISIARADAKRCHVRADGEDFVFTSDPIEQWGGVRGRANRGALVADKTVRVRGARSSRTWVRSGITVVPSIPPRHRPSSNKRIGLFHVLWEVEKWDPTPPIDPALLRHIRGDLWAVLAMWDLTPLERAVLAQRA